MPGMVYNILKNPKELKPHKTNIDIYGTESVDIDLVESIKNKGILEPLVILENNTILSGHRRWLAAKELKLERIPCRSMSFSDDLDEKEALIEFNRQRKKTSSQIVKEKKLLDAIGYEKAKIEQQQAGVDFGESHPKKEEVVDKSPQAPKPLSVAPKTRDSTAAKLNMSYKKLDQLETVFDKAESGDSYAKNLMVKLDKEDISANEAAKRVKVFTEAPEPIKEKIIKENLSAKEAVVAIEEIKKPEPGMGEHSRKILFSSEHDNWGTPEDLYNKLNKEFDFDFDPCPLNSTFDGLKTSWGKRNFINPPYSNIVGFLEKGHEEIINGNSDLLVYLIPVRTDTKWFHTYIYPYYKKETKPYADIRFIKGRIKFENGTGVKNSAPFPSMVVIIGVD